MTASNVVPFKQPVDERTYTLTLFDDRAAQNKRELTCTLDQLAYNIGIAKADDKAGLPWLKGALMGKQRSPKNSLRTNANVNTLTLLEGDYDANTAPVLLTMEDAGELIATEGLKALFYSSASDTPEEPHWRIIVPLAEPYSGTMEELKAYRNEQLAKINGVLQGALAPESFTLSQAYYFGSINGRPPARTIVLPGDHVDQRDDLPRIYKSGSDKPKDAKPRQPSDAKPISEDQFRAMVEAAAIGAKDCHYDVLVPLAMACARTNIIGREDDALQRWGADLIWSANKASKSLTRAKFDAAFKSDAPDDGSGASHGTLFHWAVAGGWKPTHAERENYDHEALQEFLRDHGLDEPEGPAPTTEGTPDLLGTTSRQAIFTRWSTPAEDALRPPITYWDGDGMLPRVEGGAAMIVTGKKSSHKTGVLLHKCFKAVFEKGAKVLYLAAEGAHGIRTARLPALCRRHGRTLEDLTGRWVTMDTAPGLMSEAQIAQAIAECKAKGFKPDIIVIDTLSRVVGTVDMNAPGTGANIIVNAELFEIGRAHV